MAEGHGITTLQAEGNKVEEVYEVTRTAIEHIHSAKGPVFLELPTYRWREHCGPNYDNDIGYRTKEEFLDWKQKDPIELLKLRVSIDGLEAEIKEIRKEIKSAVMFAKTSPFPEASAAMQHVYA